MLHTASGPFMSTLRAEHNISLALITYLCSSFTLIDPQIEEKERIRRVAKGFHGLHFYANEFWVTHFLEYVELNGGLESTSSNLILDKVVTLCDIHDSMAPSTDYVEEFSPDGVQQGGAHLSLEKLVAHTDVYHFVQKIVEFRKRTRDAQLQTSDGELAINSEDLSRYNMARPYLADLRRPSNCGH